MAESNCKPWLALAAAVAMASYAFAADKKEFRYNVAAGATISVVNEYGPVTLTPTTGRQVIITATPSSNKVEVDASQNGPRIDVRTHFLQKAGPGDGRVEYQVQVPPGANLMVHSATGPITVSKVSGDLTLEGDNASVDVRDMGSGDLRIRTINGPVVLTNVRNERVEVTSIGGEVRLSNVSGPRVTVTTTGGAIRFEGDFGQGGEYALTTHTGDLDVNLPATASVDISASSKNGTVENDVPLQPAQHPTMKVAEGHSFSGVANSGSSSVRLRSFSGKIRVKKM